MSTAIDRYADLSDKLYELTVNKKITWEEDPFGINLVCSVGKFGVSIELTENSNGNPCVIVRILASNGSRVDSFSDDDLADRVPGDNLSPSYWLLLSDLHNQARRQVTGADDALDAILKELDDKLLPF